VLVDYRILTQNCIVSL